MSILDEKKLGNLLKKNSTGSVHCISKKYFLNDIVLKLGKNTPKYW